MGPAFLAAAGQQYAAVLSQLLDLHERVSWSAQGCAN
jgi:hypothetical protein